MKYAVRELILGQRVQMSIRAAVAKTVFLFIAPVISILQHMVRNYGIAIEFHLFTMQYTELMCRRITMEHSTDMTLHRVTMRMSGETL